MRKQQQIWHDEHTHEATLPAMAHIKPAEVLYAADGLHDMKAAIGAGFNFMGVATGLVTADEFTAAGAESTQGLGLLLPDISTAQEDAAWTNK